MMPVFQSAPLFEKGVSSNEQGAIATDDGTLGAGRWRRILAEDPESILAFAERAGALRTQGRVEEARSLSHPV